MFHVQSGKRLALWLTACAFGLLLVLYLTPVLTADQRRELAAYYAQALLHPVAILALQVRRRQARSREEVAFWNLLTATFAIWFVATLVGWLPYGEEKWHGLVGDSLQLLTFLSLVLALQQRPDSEAAWPARRVLARFGVAATILFLTGLMSYFVVIPSHLEPDAYKTAAPSFYLFVTLDGILTAWLACLWLRCRRGSWRRVYAFLTSGLLLWFIGDLIDCLHYAGLFEVQLGTPLDFLFYVPIALFVAAANVPTETAPVELEGSGPDPSEAALLPTVLPLSFAFLFPLCHLGVESLGLLASESRQGRLVTVSITLLGLIALMFLQQLYLQRRNRHLQSRLAGLVTNDQMQQAQKMEALGRLAGGVAHEFNNALLVIRGYADLVLAKLSREDPLRRNVRGITDSADRAAALTKELLAFGRRQPLTPKLVDLGRRISKSQEMLTRIIGDDVTLTTEVGEGVGVVEVDPGQIVQVVVNLAVNARSAMPGGGELHIETRRETVEEGSLANRDSVPTGDYVCLEISDTGSGMDRETSERIFEPFFTTKEHGVGLGLATVHGIVSQNDGYVRVVSAPGEGTTFLLYFPRIDKARTESGSDDELVPQKRLEGKETVLLVEDEDDVRELAGKFLRGLGYDVLSAGNGEEAVHLAREFADRIRLLLTDVVMPGMSGPVLYQRISRTGLGVVFMSGYATEELPAEDQPGPSAFLQKPFTLQALEHTVRAVLDSEEPRVVTADETA